MHVTDGGAPENVATVEVVRRLRATDLFDGLDPGALEALAAAFETRTLPSGATLAPEWLISFANWASDLNEPI